jgi:hypothetical protein
MSNLRLMTVKRTIGVKLESTANQYTNNETLAAENYCFPVYDIEYSPAIEDYVRKVAYGDASKSVGVPGKRTGTVSFTCDLQPHTVVSQAPMVFTLLRACGFAQTTYGATGVGLKCSSAADRVPCTIECVERQEGATPDQLVVRFFGCMGDVDISNESTGQPVKCKFTFTGAFAGVSTRTYASAITPASFDTASVPAVLAATIWYAGTTQFCSKFSIKTNNQVELFDDGSFAQGVSGARIADRDPMIELDPDMFVTSDKDWYTDHVNATTGALAITVGPSLHINAPKGQIVQSYTPADRQGHVSNNMRIRCTRNSGNDELEILQGATS